MEWGFTPEAQEQFDQLPAGYRHALTERLGRAVREVDADEAFFQLVVNDLEVSGTIAAGRLTLDKVAARPRGFAPP